jgi:hypothetical protein
MKNKSLIALLETVSNKKYSLKEDLVKSESTVQYEAGGNTITVKGRVNREEATKMASSMLINILDLPELQKFKPGHFNVSIEITD